MALSLTLPLCHSLSSLSHLSCSCSSLSPPLPPPFILTPFIFHSFILSPSHLTPFQPLSEQPPPPLPSVTPPPSAPPLSSARTLQNRGRTGTPADIFVVLSANALFSFLFLGERRRGKDGREGGTEGGRRRGDVAGEAEEVLRERREELGSDKGTVAGGE